MPPELNGLGSILTGKGAGMDSINTSAAFLESLSSVGQLSELFHMVNRILPDDHTPVAVSSTMPAGDALALMETRGFSQVPVMEGKFVLGLFSYRAFALEVAKLGKQAGGASSLPVFEFLEHEKPVYAGLKDEFRSLIDVLDTRDCVIVSSAEDLVALLTPMDVLRYLYSVADAFVLIEEIELALRALITEAVPNTDLLRTCVERGLSHKYGTKELPRDLGRMSFGDYVALIGHGKNWPHFSEVLGGTRERARGKLEPVGELRNAVFHFRRELAGEDHQLLCACRDWLLRCTRRVHAKQGGA